MGYTATEVSVTNSIRAEILRIFISGMNFAENSANATILEYTEFVVLFIEFRKVVVAVANKNPDRYSTGKYFAKKITSQDYRTIT